MQKAALIQDFRCFHFGWRIWMLLLHVVNLVAPLFFLGRPEAWVVLAGYVLAAAILMPLHRRYRL